MERIHLLVMKLLFSREQINERVAELAEQISRDYAGKQITLLGVLKGGAIFHSDLARRLKPETITEFVRTKSYSGTKSTGKIELSCEPGTENITGRHVIIVEDIIDTGVTLEFLTGYLTAMNPASLAVVSFLFKREKAQGTKPDYTGFEIGDDFVVGYGMDHDEKYRNLGEIYILT